MGIYYGSYENPCARCGTGRVNTCFISVTPMSFYARCDSCGAEDFTQEELDTMSNVSKHVIDLWSGSTQG